MQPGGADKEGIALTLKTFKVSKQKIIPTEIKWAKNTGICKKRLKMPNMKEKIFNLTNNPKQTN